MNSFTVIFIFFNFFYVMLLYPLGNSNETSVEDTANNNNNNSDEIMNYLYTYGYLEDMENMTHDKLENAIMEYQHFIGIEPSGAMNSETTEMMHRPRCGRPDVLRRRSKRYTFNGNKTWSKPELSFYIDQYTEDLQSNVVHDEIQKALNVWSEFTKIRFMPSSDGKRGDINVTFCSQDGEGRALGYAYNPTSGTVLLDEDEKWTKDNENGVNLFQVAVHEFGHTLGLGHTDNEKAVMYPYYMGFRSNYSLHMDDIRGIKALYRFNPHLEVKQGGDNTILCQNSKIDAIFAAPDDYVYLLKEDKYWKLTNEFVIAEGPKLITSRWPEVPSNVDCAFTSTNNITYFFKRQYLWKYTLDKKTGNSKLISVAFSGIPNNLDAAFMWSGNGKIYFFKGESYWRFDVLKPPSMRVKRTYPHSILNWNGFPNNIDAAVAVGGVSYFFKDDKYYKYDDMRWETEKGYPKNIARDFFRCN